jgi:hypothetical protein
MSATRHADTRFVSFTGAGKRPLRTPAHHVDLPIGRGRPGPRNCLRRTNPTSGSGLFSQAVVRSPLALPSHRETAATFGGT